MPPPYVAVVLAARILFPSTPWLAIQIFQALLSACTVVFIYLIGREIFTELIGVLASFLIAVYPPTLGYVLDIQAVAWETFWVTLTGLACICWYRSRTRKHAMLMGFVLGIAVLSRSNLTLLLPLLFVWMVLNHGRRGVVHFIAAVCVLILILGPWVVRNYLVHGEFVLVSTNGGFTMFEGNNAHATGVSYLSLGNVWKQYPELAAELAQLDEAARDKRLYQESIVFIRTHPKETFSLALKKFIYLWWFKPGFIKGGISSGYPWYYGAIYVVSYVTLLVFSVSGLVLSFKKYQELFVIYALLFVQTFVGMIFIAGTRYRAILEPLLIVLAGYGIVCVFLRRFRIPRGACQAQE